MCQKAPSAKRCIKTYDCWGCGVWFGVGQKAPSAKRCIKTRETTVVAHADGRFVRKHRAPKGALRPVKSRSILHRW